MSIQKDSNDHLSKLDFSYFDPLNLHTLYPAIANTYAHNPIYSKTVLIKKIQSQLCADFASHQALIFPDTKSAYHHFIAYVFPEDTLFFIDRYADTTLFDLLKKYQRKRIVIEHTNSQDLKTHLLRQARSTQTKVIFTSTLFLYWDCCELENKANIM